uniref:Uncharacterized protein n=1 Tax=Heterorhabditis bacteriophora TaxID=37862 RepID=A0A1I7WHF8_HETBA
MAWGTKFQYMVPWSASLLEYLLKQFMIILRKFLNSNNDLLFKYIFLVVLVHFKMLVNIELKFYLQFLKYLYWSVFRLFLCMENFVQLLRPFYNISSVATESVKQDSVYSLIHVLWSCNNSNYRYRNEKSCLFKIFLDFLYSRILLQFYLKLDTVSCQSFS